MLEFYLSIELKLITGFACENSVTLLILLSSMNLKNFDVITELTFDSTNIHLRKCNVDSYNGIL